MQNNFKFLTYEEDQGIGILTLNREDKLNALNSDVFDELEIFFESVKNQQLKGLIFTGAGQRAFIAGADIASMQNMTSDQAFEFAHKGQKVTLLFESAKFPIIAAVNGFALGGGCEMALACDFIYCTENAVFGLPEASLGLIPGFGGTQRLAKIVGRNRAKEMIFTGRKITANEARQIGLAIEVCSNKDELIEKAKSTLNSIFKNSANAVSIAKLVINNGCDLTIDKGLEVERNHFGKIFDSYDMKEGTSAFLERRKPQFKGE